MIRFEHREECMGTSFRFAGNSPLSPAETQSRIDAACAILHEADRTFSLYKPESPLSKLARGEASVATCPPVVSEIWDDCERWEKVTDGWFSAFTPEHTFDPSGVVKTWAAMRAANHLLEGGIVDFTMNAGGDVWISDAATDPLDWKIAIHKPVSIAAEDAGVLTVVDFKDKPFRALATSGSAERGLHIWNPKAAEKQAAQELLQVSVAARDLVTADVWATAVFARGGSAVAALNAHNLAHPEDQVQALLVWPDGNLTATDGFVELFPRG